MKIPKKVVKRLRNPKVLVALVSGIAMILVNIGVIDVSMSDKAVEITNMILGLGVTVGIFGDPESHVKE